MAQTLQQRPTVMRIEAEKDVKARIYYFRFKSSFGFATDDPTDPARGQKPIGRNFFIMGRHFVDNFDLRLLREKGDFVIFDIDPQDVEEGQAIEARRIRLVR